MSDETSSILQMSNEAIPQPATLQGEHGESSAQQPIPRSLDRAKFKQLTTKISAQLSSVFNEPLGPTEFEIRREKLRQVLELPLDSSGRLAGLTQSVYHSDLELPFFPPGSMLAVLYVTGITCDFCPRVRARTRDALEYDFCGVLSSAEPDHKASQQNETPQQDEASEAEHGRSSPEVELKPFNPMEFDLLLELTTSQLMQVFARPLSTSEFERRCEAMRKVLEHPLHVPESISFLAEETDSEIPTFACGSLLEILYISENGWTSDVPLRPRTLRDCPYYGSSNDPGDDRDIRDVHVLGPVVELAQGEDLDDFDEDFDDEQNPRHLSEAQLDALPRVLLDESMLDEYGHAHCVICRDDVSLSTEVTLLPCGHNWFHPDCLKPWLRTQDSCVICRKSVLAGLADNSGDGEGEGPGANQEAAVPTVVIDLT